MQNTQHVAHAADADIHGQPGLPLVLSGLALLVQFAVTGLYCWELLAQAMR